MTDPLWTTVDNYLSDLFLQPDSTLNAALESSKEGGLEPINVSPVQGKFLHILAKCHNAKNILEIGTLGGYSTIWLARALPSNGRLITLEANPKHAEIARANIARADLSSAVEVRLGRAQETLPRLLAEHRGPFDFIFIDADKSSYSDYFAWSLRLARRGTIIIADNVIRKGAVADASSTDANVQGVRRFNQMVAAEPRVSATAIQTVGSKGYDGFTIMLVNRD
ncbi:MAG TPA: O-methyltransferase [Candidatus Aquilonibacter sp.]|nr:O-methyltransferase [Candidatus Aquilonibacter sp.]